MPDARNIDFPALYTRLRSPIAALDCGHRCSPYNENGIPFCCDTRHAVPTAYLTEWEYLQANTELWHVWQVDNPEETTRLQSQTPPGQVMIACLGPAHCQREFRSLTCRAFPFFPYFNRKGDFLGLSYYWDFEDRCWVISNLQAVTPEYWAEFIHAYDLVFERMPGERENFHHHSTVMRRIFGRRGRAISLLHRNGYAYKITPSNGRLRRVPIETLPRFGPYRVAAQMPFADEISPA